MIGQRFGRLTVVSRAGRNADNRATYLCMCDCGSEKIIAGKAMRSGKTQSCGCYQRQRIREAKVTHGLTSHHLWVRWNNMMRRCYDTSCPAYINYGARGITVCDRWHDIRNFVADNEHHYVSDLTLDRIDNDGNYSPENTHWTTRTEQSRNRRNNIRYTYGGRTLTLAEWADAAGIKKTTLWRRLREHGWSFEDAITTRPK